MEHCRSVASEWERTNDTKDIWQSLQKDWTVVKQKGRTFSSSDETGIADIWFSSQTRMAMKVMVPMYFAI